MIDMAFLRQRLVKMLSMVGWMCPCSIKLSPLLCGLSAFPYMGIAVPVNGATSQDTFYCAHVVVCRIFADMLNL